MWKWMYVWIWNTHWILKVFSLDLRMFLLLREKKKKKFMKMRYIHSQNTANVRAMRFFCIYVSSVMSVFDPSLHNICLTPFEWCSSSQMNQLKDLFAKKNMFCPSLSCPSQSEVLVDSVCNYLLIYGFIEIKYILGKLGCLNLSVTRLWQVN